MKVGCSGAMRRFIRNEGTRVPWDLRWTTSTWRPRGLLLKDVELLSRGLVPFGVDVSLAFLVPLARWLQVCKWYLLLGHKG